MNQNFNGFPNGLSSFLFELHFDNNLQMQNENKEKYKRIITQPLTRLYEALIPTVLDIYDGFDTRLARCVSSPYTDRRFCPDTPLKEYMYIRFKQYGKTEDVPGLYFDMGADYYSYGLRIYNQTSQGMEKLRLKITDTSDTSEQVLKKIYSSGFSAFGEKYKNDRYPGLPDSVVKELLNYKRFYIGKDVAVNESIYSPALTYEIREGFVQMKDILHFLV